MKNKTCVLPGLVGLTCLFVDASASSQTRYMPPPRPTQAELHFRNSFRVFQAERLGEDAEQIQARRQIEELAPAKFDLDGNGRFDEVELNQWLRAVQLAIVKSPGAMNRFDANRDGKLDATEWSAVVDHLTGKS